MSDDQHVTELEWRLDLAYDAALKAGELILGHYQSAGLAVERKRDSSPVTAADRGAEELIRAEIRAQFPDDGILGEELGEHPGRNGFRWVLDPLDGTKSFIHGVPLFGTLIGVQYQGKNVIGVCHFPALGETAWGTKGLGAWWERQGGDAQPARVSSVADFDQALLCITTIQGFARIGRQDAFETLVAKAGLTRGWGDCYGHILVATGRAEIMVDPLMNLWDAAALVPIVEEAGGHFVDWNGRPRADSGNGISVNAALRDEVLAITRR